MGQGGLAQNAGMAMAEAGQGIIRRKVMAAKAEVAAGLCRNEVSLFLLPVYSLYLLLTSSISGS